MTKQTPPNSARDPPRRWRVLARVTAAVRARGLAHRSVRRPIGPLATAPEVAYAGNGSNGDVL